MKIEKPDNLLDHFEQSTDKFKNNKLYGTKNKETGEFEWITYGEVRKRVDNFRSGLATLNIKKDDSVAIISNNRVEWAVAVFATYGLGARFVPMYENEIPKTWEYITNDAEVKFILVANREIYEKVKHFKDKYKSVEHIYIIDDEGKMSMNHLEVIGKENQVESVAPNVDDIAGLIYTSGTTGDPKGVLLTHGNLVSNARAGYHRYHMLNESSVSLSILPWAHSYGQTAELYNWLFFGGSIGFMEKVETLAEDLLKVRPTFLIAVPRVFNTIYDGIHAKMNETGGIKKKLFDMSVRVAKLNRENNGKIGFLNKMKLKLGDKLVFSKIRDKFGGRLVAAITASAKMNMAISYFFSDIGLPVFDCYGLSETSPAVCMNSPELNRPGSIGTPLEFIQVRIDKSMIEDVSADGEIQVYGPNLMVGYHNKPEATKKVFTEDGWLKTGDRGTIDEDGFVYITGRIKEQYKLENGKYVFPAEIEEDIRLLPYIENAMIYGDGRAYNVCLVVPNIPILKKTADLLNMKTTVDQLVHSKVVQEFMGIEIHKSLKGNYGGYEIPKKFIFINENFSIENGMLTQTLKLKRRLVIEKYKDQIEELYSK